MPEAQVDDPLLLRLLMQNAQNIRLRHSGSIHREERRQRVTVPQLLLDCRTGSEPSSIRSRGWTRTNDPAVNSRLLYQLSHSGIGETPSMTREFRFVLETGEKARRADPAAGAPAIGVDHAPAAATTGCFRWSSDAFKSWEGCQ